MVMTKSRKKKKSEDVNKGEVTDMGLSKKEREGLEIVGESKKKTVNKKLPSRVMPQLTFDSWWMQTQKRHGFKNDIKEVVFKHFRARGFLDSKKFDDGLKDFGIKS